MKKNTFWSLMFLAILLLVAIMSSCTYPEYIPPACDVHYCKDTNHYYCDGGETSESMADSLGISITNDTLMCDCDGLGCNSQ